MREIGLNIRLTRSLQEVVAKALLLNLKIFQCFFTSKQTGYRLYMDPGEIQKFLKEQRHRFNDLYLHASYWINLSNDELHGAKALEREILLAKKLAFNYVVVHPGATKDAATDRLEGVDVLARNLNFLLKKEHDINILLENTAHGNNSIGSDISDFALLKEKLDHPEKINFCIDTAHAYSFGYDITHTQGRHEFMHFLDTTLGLGNIKLIHLNDTQEMLGSKVDKHGIIGSGNIGMAVLKEFVAHPAFVHIPIILELPVMNELDEKMVLEKD